MFGFLKNIFGGIFGFLGKILGFGKKSEYAYEFEAKPAAKAMTASQPAPKAETAKTAAPKAAAKPATAEKATTKQEKPAKVENPAPAAAKKPEPAKAPAPVSGFSTQYLTPTATATRRRPGANMTSYLDMARQVNTTR
ncbi:hypothetical protein NG798_08910 [Ancylothrix sp. C2]|uniref:hypothetical protein n=1 Tax=Ancylothrix sp. D3o TaxID=2953691 RepID=UPI0021BAD71D|nr:hypothetical protein [Ancylothrix sp. D3o]MCT7949904.1 hypothetical protein [Ancylothrix sp. D3o]